MWPFFKFKRLHLLSALQNDCLHHQQVGHLSCFSLACRWRRLKAQMIEKRSKLGESQTLQQFSRDVDEIEAWISEKLQTASDESYKDPTNIQVLRYYPALLWRHFSTCCLLYSFTFLEVLICFTFVVNRASVSYVYLKRVVVGKWHKPSQYRYSM